MHAELKEYVKRWFWELHNWVNESLSRPLYPYDSLAGQYSRLNIRAALVSLDVPMKRAIRVRSGQLLSYIEFVKQVNILLSIYGI
jgi:hypothetical protein